MTVSKALRCWNKSCSKPVTVLIWRAMSKPLSRPNELGRAIGYRVDIDLILERLKGAPPGSWEELRTDRSFVAQMQQAALLHGGSSSLSDKPVTKLWVVMKAEHGIPVMMDAYPDKRSANRREKFLRQHMRPDVDQVAVFDVKL